MPHDPMVRHPDGGLPGDGGGTPVPSSAASAVSSGPVPSAPRPAMDAGSPKIQAFDQRLGSGSKSPEDRWKRSPVVTGKGASHVKSFHCKLNNESLDFLDQQVNEWLDAHPQFEVKMATTSVGEWNGKQGREPNVIMQIWV